MRGIEMRAARLAVRHVHGKLFISALCDNVNISTITLRCVSVSEPRNQHKIAAIRARSRPHAGFCDELRRISR